MIPGLNFVIHEGQFTIFDERRGHFGRRRTDLWREGEASLDCAIGKTNYGAKNGEKEKRRTGKKREGGQKSKTTF